MSSSGERGTSGVQQGEGDGPGVAKRSCAPRFYSVRTDLSSVILCTESSKSALGGRFGGQDYGKPLQNQLSAVEGFRVFARGSGFHASQPQHRPKGVFGQPVLSGLSPKSFQDVLCLSLAHRLVQADEQIRLAKIGTKDQLPERRRARRAGGIPGQRAATALLWPGVPQRTQLSAITCIAAVHPRVPSRRSTRLHIPSPLSLTPGLRVGRLIFM